MFSAKFYTINNTHQIIRADDGSKLEDPGHVVLFIQLYFGSNVRMNVWYVENCGVNQMELWYHAKTDNEKQTWKLNFQLQYTFYI
jgi:hypothetical protein